MAGNRPQLGPWLRRYQVEQKATWRDRAEVILVGTVAVVLVGIVLLIVLKWFFRYPVITIGVLAAVWLVGFVIAQLLRRQERSRGR